MNKHTYKVIYNARQQTLNVVSEHTVGQSKSSSSANQPAEHPHSTATTAHPLKTLFILLLLSLGTAQQIQAQIIADPHAPKNQQAIILRSASGATQINIQTPSAQGISVNQYSRFDTQSNGTLLNNSRSNTSTQTAGMIQGNPYLGAGSARIIINQINSNSPSQLQGNLEIAGQRAELIIANPAGIQANGITILNASSSTLTTGQPQINSNGNLDGYRVTQGQITVNGQGLDTSDSDYTQLIARNLTLNAGVWAKQLTVTTGANQIDASNNASAIAGTSSAPSYALDSSALGGMYAGKITFIGTEQGLGINNAGQIAASAGNVSLSANGQLSNSGSISSQSDTQIHSSTIRNSGTLSAGQTLSLTSSSIDNTNGTLNGQRLDLTAEQLTNSQGKIQQTGQQALVLNAGLVSNSNGGLIGNAPIDTSTGTTNGTTNGTNTNTNTNTTNNTSTTAPSTATGGSTTTVEPAPALALPDGQLNITGTLDNSAGQITANGGTDLSSTNGLTNHGTLNLNQLTISGNTLDNSHGNITASQLSIHTQRTDNSAGQLASSHSLDLDSTSLNNDAGQISANDSAQLHISQELSNHNGSIASGNALSINAGQLNNSAGTISSNSANATLSIDNSLNNSAGQIQAATDLSIHSNGLNNSAGHISGSQTQINSNSNSNASNSTTNSLNNAHGSIAAQRLSIDSGSLNNDTGLIQSDSSLDLNSHGQSISNQHSDASTGIRAGSSLTINANTPNASALNNSTGLISSNGQLSIAASDLNNAQGQILSDNTLNLTSTNLDNSAGTLQSNSNAQLHIKQSLNNNSGTISSTNALDLHSANLDNSAGTIISANSANLSIDNGLNNSAGQIQAATDLSIHSNGLNNSAGHISGSQTQINSNSNASNSTSNALNNDHGSIAAQRLSIDSGSLNNDTGLIQSDSSLDINSHGQSISNQHSDASTGIRAGSSLTINTNSPNASALNNSTGLISSTGPLSIAAGDLNNAQGQILSDDSLNLTSTNLDNSAGTLHSNSDSSLQITGQLTNDNGQLNAGHNLALNATSLSNRNGQILASTGDGQLHIAGNLDNSAGSIQAANALGIDTHTNSPSTLTNDNGTIASNSLTIDSNSLSNISGLIQGNNQLRIDTHGHDLNNSHSGSQGGLTTGGTLQLTTAQLTNTAGYIGSSQSASLNASQIDNSQQGHISSQSDLTLNGTGLNNSTGQIQSQGNTSINLGTGSLNNHNGLIRTNDSLSISASTLDNSQTASATPSTPPSPDQGLNSNDLNLNIDNLNNANGSIIVNHDLGLTGNGAIDNSAGQISAGNDLSIQGTAGHTALTKTQTLLNAAGSITAGHNSSIDTQSLTGNGTVSANQDMSLNLTDDYHNSSTLQAGHDLNLISLNGITNSSSILAGNALTLTAHTIDNSATGEITGSASTHISGSQLTNRGLIDGSDTRIDTSTSINNLGTGRIYGDQISIATGTLNNRNETINGSDSAGTIAAREQLDIGAATINNQEHGSLYSLGNLNIGGTLDSNGHATGQAATLNNYSATIESQGDMSLAAQQINNINDHFATGTRTTTERIGEVIGSYDIPQPSQWGPLPTAQSAVYRIDPTQLANHPNFDYLISSPYQLSSAGNPDNVFVAPDQSNTLVTPDGAYSSWNLYDYIRTTTETTVTSSDPSQIIAGGNLTLDTSNLLNDNSQILVGGTLQGTANAITNSDTKGQRQVSDNGIHNAYWYMHHGQDALDNLAYSLTNPAQTIDISTSLVKQHTNGNGNSLVIANGSNAATSVIASASAANGSTDLHNTDTSSSTSHGQQVTTNGTDTSTANIALSTASTDTTNPALIKTGSINTTLPTSSLYTTNPNNPDHLIQTDPRFTNNRQWLSSDWMLNALKLDPTQMHKRLGDGFYEQRLIREQIAQLTGRRYLDGYNNDDAQYQALMDNGLTTAQRYNLRPGIALTAEQMAGLTSDIVWLVNQTITLPDGTQTTALVPKVYVRTRPGDIDGTGSLISANALQLNLHTLDNNGTLSGRHIMSINADTINNQNGGRLNASDMRLHASTDINNIGGLIDARNSLVASAGHNINLVSTTSASEGRYGNSRSNGHYAITGLDRIAGLYVGTGEGSNPAGLQLSAGNDLNLTGAVLSNDGTGQSHLSAGHDLNLDTVKTSNQIDTGLNLGHQTVHDSQSSSTEIGTNINSRNGIVLSAGHDLNATAASVNSETGNLIAQAGHDLNIQAGHSTSDNTHSDHNRKSTFFKTTVTDNQDNSHSDTAVSSSFTGEHVLLKGSNDINVIGSNVVASQGLELNAGHDIAILNASEQSDQHHEQQKTTTGLLDISPTSLTIGKRTQNQQDRLSSTATAKSKVGSLSGSTTLIAGHHYQQTGSDVLALDGGDVNISAQSVDIIAATDTADSSSASQTKQSGLTVAISNPIVDALQTGFNLAQAASKSSNGRTQALAVGSAALTALNTYNAVQPHTGADGQSHSSLTNVTVSATYGTSKSSSTSNQHASTSVGSTIQAGGNVNISATGAGQNSNINIIGSDINAGHSTALTADNQLNILSADNAIDQSASHKSSSIAAGVSATFGSSGIGIGGTLSGSTGKGHGNGQDISHSNSHINSQQINISTGGDTTLRGAILNANTITGNIGGNLSIESQQDTSTYTAKDKNLSASITAGAGVSGSASYNSSKINNDYASVKEQTGLFARDGGYQLTVKGHTSLTGGAITSSQSAIDQGLNTLNTGSLEVADINNHADYSASSMGISLSGGIAGKDDSSGKGVHLAQQSSTPGGTMGYGSDSGHASSTTRSALSQGSVTITDPDKTSASQAALARVDRSTSTETQSSGYIAPNFNQTQVIDEVTAQRDITQTFGSQAAQAIGDYANHKQAQDLAKAQLAASQGQNIDGKSAAEWQAEAGHWSEGGAYRIGLHALAGGATGGLQGALGAAGASAAAPAINQALVDMGVQGTIAGQVIGGAAAMGIGYATGGMSGAASGFNEDANNRQLHQNETKILNKLVDKTKSETEKLHLVMAACTIVHCADGVPKSDPRYEDLISEQSQGSKYTTEINQLKAAGFGGYTKLDGISDAVTRNSAIFPSATSNIEGQLVINSFRANAPSAKVQTEQYLVNQAKAVCGSGGNFQKCGNANQAIRNFAQANNGLSTAVANRYIQNVDNGVYNAMANETKSTSANVREAVNNVRQTGKEALDCATLKGCTTGGALSIAGLVGDFAGAGSAMRVISAEADLAATGAKNSLAEINQARIDNNFYADHASSNLYQDRIEQLSARSTHNPNSNTVVLGSYVRNSSSSYEQVAKAQGATYFEMPGLSWNNAVKQLGKDQIWDVNKQFLDEQMAQGKSFVFTVNPEKAIYDGTFTRMEYEHLTNNGYQLIKEGGMYHAIKK